MEVSGPVHVDGCVTVRTAAAVIQRESQAVDVVESEQLQHCRHQERHQLDGRRKRPTDQESRPT